MCKSIFFMETSRKNSPRTNQTVLEEDPTWEKNYHKQSHLRKVIKCLVGQSTPVGGGRKWGLSLGSLSSHF